MSSLSTNEEIIKKYELDDDDMDYMFADNNQTLKEVIDKALNEARASERQAILAELEKLYKEVYEPEGTHPEGAFYLKAAIDTIKEMKP